MRGVSRRFMLSAPLALAALHPASAAAKQRSYTATHGAAPFATEHLIPGDALDLAGVDLSSSAARVIALTIDDGPDPHDLRILEILRQHDAWATFFYIGNKVPGALAVARTVAASGHEVGNHSFAHPMMTDIAGPTQVRNLTDANAELARVGVKPTWFRPPFGDFDDAVVAEARAAELRTVLWTVDTKDWKGLDATAIAQRVTDRLVPGAVVLMHSTKAASVAALPRILDEGTRQGYRFVTMTEWHEAMKAASPVAVVSAPKPRPVAIAEGVPVQTEKPPLPRSKPKI